MPGNRDDTRGCATVLSTIRALNAAGIETKGDIQFVGTVQEEGTGALKGMQYYVNHHPELDASISVDGPGFQEITYEATGIQTYEINFHASADMPAELSQRWQTRSMRQDVRSRRSLRSRFRRSR